MPSTASVIRAALVAGVASAVSVDIQPRQMVTSTCSDVHIFLGKGNNEPYPGRQGKLVSAICSGLSSCDYEDIQMHNMLSDEYCGAVSEGTQHGYEQIIAYNKRCPNSKLVVSGFSQGAHVVGDIFSGGGGSFFQGCQTRATPNVPFNTPAGQAIAAIVTFGDVRHTANQPYNYLGGATKWGLFPRNSQQLANAIQYAGVWRDYCALEDPVCAGGNVVDDHLNYFDLYSNEVADYVHQKLRAAAPPPSATTTVRPSAPAPTKSAAPVTVPPYGNPHGSNQTVVTVTDETGSVITIYTTVCPATLSYVPNPTAETKPPHITATHEYPLPEASVSTTFSIPYVATGNNTVPQPTATNIVPSSAGSNLAKMGGVLGMAIAAAAALL